MLSVLGYQVLEAGDRLEALQIVESYDQPIDLLLTDVVMPRVNGRQLADNINALRPETAVLFMSGYDDDIIANHGILDENIHFLSKPFTPIVLADKVREVLESRGRAK